LGCLNLDMILTSHLNCSSETPDKSWSRNFFTATSCNHKEKASREWKLSKNRFSSQRNTTYILRQNRWAAYVFLEISKTFQMFSLKVPVYVKAYGHRLILTANLMCVEHIHIYWLLGTKPDAQCLFVVDQSLSMQYKDGKVIRP